MIIILTLVLYLVYGFVNAKANIHSTWWRTPLWMVLWLPTVVVDLIVNGDRSIFIRSWKWL